MQSFFDSIANEGDARGDFLDNFEAYQEKAKEYLKGVIGDKIKRAKTCLEEARCYLEPPQKGEEFVQAVLSQLNSFSVSEGFYPLCRQISGVLLPDLPRVKMDGEYKKLLAKAKELVKEAQSLTDQYSQLSEEEVRELERGDLSKVLIKFYNLYQERYSILKARRGVLDFADIERYAHKLLQYEDIKKALQDKYDYIFIDEYQDTNRLQESILKPIAEGGYFTAVGDIKQGIYGFRNASKEIMLQDIADFDASEDGQALYLTGNFRTDDRILSFVNDIFEKIMTVESCGIDYKDKSKLVGLQTFEKNGLCPVSVDIVCGEEVEKEPATGVYSVREDIVEEDDKFSLELACIEGRINEVLATKLYDAKNKVFRDARQSDIALLFRSRSGLMKECVKHLRAKGFAVDADIKNCLLEDGQIRVIASLIKLSINIEDDISLASVMASAIGGFSLQELSDLRLEQREEDFWQIVLNSKSEKIENFLGKIKDFTFDCQVFGITKALQKIFNKCGYYDYLASLADGREKVGHINDLFKLIKESECDFKPASLINILEQDAKQKGSQEGNVDAIKITTIHATKGLEYPVVILCGCGDSLSKVYTKNYILNQTFGLGCLSYDFENDSQVPSPSFMAGKIKKAKEEFEGELMIFYVALTRAQNHLYIIGSGKQKNFSFDEIEKQNSYLKLIAYALGENFISQLFQQGQIAGENRRFQIVSEVENQEVELVNKIKINEKTQKFQEKIKKYQEFSYKKENYCKINYKNSVTGILKLEEDEHFERENKLINEIKTFENSSLAVQRGNAYHEALKLINLSKINSLESFNEEFDKIKPLMQREYIDLIDNNILYKNIKLINGLVNNQTVFKEREFLMKTPLKDIGIEGDDCVIVQGIVDFFVIGEKNILIDFKFTSADKETIIKRYQKQIDLYSKAIERAFNIKLDERYLLSLKKAELIKL